MLSNVRGLAIAGASVGAMLALGHRYPDLRSDPFFDVYTATLFAVVSIAAAAQGIRARLLFIPAWFAGLGAVCWAFAGLGGGWWTAAGGTGIVAVLAGLIVIGVEDEHRQWREAPDKLLAAKDAALAEDWPAFWRAAQRAFFYKGSGPFSLGVCTHDCRVLELVASQGPAADHPPCLRVVREQLEQGLRSQAQETRVDPKALGELQKWLDTKAAA